jgi:hypothetical protein
MDIDETKLKVTARPAKKHPSRVGNTVSDLDADLRTADLWQVLGYKGGCGKTFFAETLIAYALSQNRDLRILQVERTAQLQERYPKLTDVVSPPTSEEIHKSSLSFLKSYEIWGEVLEAAATTGRTVVCDVGSGLLARAHLEFLAKTRVGAHLKSLGIRTKTFLVIPSDPVGMQQSIEFGRALQTVQPSAEIVPIVNLFLSDFKFKQGSPSHRVWQETVEPFLVGRRLITMPLLDEDVWKEFHDLGKTFHDIATADEAAVKRWLNMGWTTASSMHGEVSVWLGDIWAALEPVLGVTSAKEDNNA